MSDHSICLYPWFTLVMLDVLRPSVGKRSDLP